MDMTNAQLLQFAAKAVSPYHAVSEAAQMLADAGFTAISKADEWNLVPGGCYYVDDCGGTLVAFRVHTPGRFRVAASHTEWPGFRIKPSPEMTAAGCVRLNAEPYGGAVLSTWMDRPLSAAGKVVVRGETPFDVTELLVDFQRPIAVIPNLAIHMNRDVNRGVELTPACDMVPITATLEDRLNADGCFLNALAKVAGVDAADILSYDLCLYNAQPGCEAGLHNDFILSPRLDNLTSTLACVNGLCHSSGKTGIDVIALFDHEEVGSKSKQGADSSLLSFLLEKISLSLGMDRAQHLNALMSGFLLSCDVAHALHPNHPEKYDPVCTAALNSGVTVKLNFTQRYPTDAAAFGAVEALCKENEIPFKVFMNRSGSPGGGTIGAYVSADLCMPAVDVGVPILAMHSAMETMGAKDMRALNNLCIAYFSC